MLSGSGEYITVDFTAEELSLISERAMYLAEVEEISLFWRQVYWQLSLVANHLSMLLERDEGNSILEDYEQE